MINYSKFLFGACVCSCIMLAVTSCKDTDEFFDKGDNPKEEANDFDFSTTQDVDLQVIYKGFELHGPVFFSIYSEDPIVDAGTEMERVNENIKPIYQAYTNYIKDNDEAIFDASITLPSYAKELHVVTGDFMIGLNHSTVEVVKKEARVLIEKDAPAAQSRSARRAPGTGTSTNDLTKLFGTAYEWSKSGSQSTQRYKDWATPLGTWNSATGRPDYLIDKATCDPKLIFSDEDFNGLYNTVKNALNSGTTCKEFYRASADLTLAKASEVTITALGSMTCWNSSLGYYYYKEENKPKSRMDLNIIMLFPNTQDGQRDPKWDYQNNIGTVRGDAIQLMYYPNIANNDFSDATTVFPAGTKIGFILKPNSWGNISREHCSKKTATYFWDKRMNIWASSTEGMSFANPNLCALNIPNPNGDARTAKFAYESKNGDKYAIVSFEDACDDEDYDDLLFALNPSNIFTELAKVEQGKTTTSGVYAFEDMWPERGDYDMNDVMVDCKHQMEFSGGKVKKEIYHLTTYQNVVSKVSGLALKLKTKAATSSIVMKKGSKTCTFTKEGDVYYLTDDIKSEINTTYTFEITYSTAQELKNLAEIEPFIYGVREGKHWEVHLPEHAPTDKMDMSFFGTYDDASDIAAGRYYVRNSIYPFAFYLEGSTAEDFFDTILELSNESKAIDTFYPDFIKWSRSKGAESKDWYLHPKK